MDLEAPVSEDELTRFRAEWQAEVKAQAVSAKAQIQKENSSTLANTSVLSSHTTTFPKTALGEADPNLSTTQTSSATAAPALQQRAVSPTSKTLSDPHSDLHSDLQPDLKTLNQAQSLAKPSSPSSSSLSHKSPNSQTSLQYYTDAMHFERVGNMTEAVRCYRLALRIDPNIESHYRELFLKAPNSLPAVSKEFSSVHDETIWNHHHYQYKPNQPDVIPDHVMSRGGESDGLDHVTFQPSESHVLTDLMESFKTLQFNDIPKHSRKQYSVNLLPEEIQMKLLLWSLVLDVSTLPILSSLSKRWCVLSHRATVWKALAEMTCACQGIAGAVLFNHYDRCLKSWRLTYFSMPRVRFNGVYIARFSYVRQGLAESTYAPYHHVTYFRYLRFFPNGRCFWWTSTMEPVNALKFLSQSEWSLEERNAISGLVMNSPKEFAVGTWTWQSHDSFAQSCRESQGQPAPSPAARHAALSRKTNAFGVINVTVFDPRRDANVFHLFLDLTSTGKGRMNRLSWRRYYTNQYTSRKALMYNDKEQRHSSEFDIEEYRSFIFSRVKSWPQAQCL